MDGRLPAPEALPREVCILGTRREEFVEFRFSLGSPDLALELVMPFRAFRQFCRREAARIVMADAAAEAAYLRLERAAGGAA